MSTTAPFSVIIPLYNKGELVTEAIRSVLAGTRLPREIIVIDDGSTDSGAMHVTSLGSPLVRLVRQENAGVSAARNRGIREAKADFIAFLDADDYWESDHLARIDHLRTAFPKAALYGTGFYLLYPDGSHRSPRIRRLKRNQGPQRVRHFYETWSRGNFFCASSVAVSRRRLVGGNIYFPEGERLGEDQDVWFRLAEQGPVAYDPAASVAYRQAVNQSLSQASLPLTPLPYVARLAERYAMGAIPQIHRPGVEYLLASNLVDRALRHARQGMCDEALRLLRHPLSRKAGITWWRVSLQLRLGRLLRHQGVRP